MERRSGKRKAGTDVDVAVVGSRLPRFDFRRDIAAERNAHAVLAFRVLRLVNKLLRAERKFEPGKVVARDTERSAAANCRHRTDVQFITQWKVLDGQSRHGGSPWLRSTRLGVFFNLSAHLM